MGMNLDRTVLRHPAREQLVAFAESLVDRSASVSSAIASHVSSCPRCTAEVRAIRASLEFAAAAPEPEPSGDLARQIMAGAREARLQRIERPRRRSMAGSLFRAMMYTAATVVLAVFIFGTAVGQSPGDISAPSVSRAVPRMAQTPVIPSAESLQRKAGAIERLSAAVARNEGPPRTLRERERLRTLDDVNQDINAAMTALARNPGCIRADEMIRSHLDRQVESLRDLFVERTL